MTYRAGIDLGTTYTAAAVWRDGEARPEVFNLGSRGAAIPSVVFVDVDGSVLVGEVADARATSDPLRVAREFKRRLGDPAPILLGGSPWSPEALLAEVLRHVVGRITAQEGSPPSAVTLTHPANWGPYKVEQFRQVPALADLPCPTDLVTEPDAAAAHYAAASRTPAGAVVAVYDLGGGTFDATVLRVGEGGRPSVVGTPEGIDRLGGIDVDAAVLDHVRANAAHLFDELDPDDPLALSSLAALRDACRQAKETLSEDTQATVTVALPTGVAQVRITRAELEAAITPQVKLTVAAMQRALSAAGVAPEQVDAVLLVGGASRMPIVSQSVSAALGRPVAVDADPKHAIALGAARGVPDVPAVPTPPQPDAGSGDRRAASADPEPVPGTPHATPRRRRRVLVGASLLAVVVAAGAAAYLGREVDDPPRTFETVATIAGTGQFDDAGDHGPAEDASLQSPAGIAVDANGRIILADEGASRIRAITPDGIMTPITSEVLITDGGDDEGGVAIANGELLNPTSVAAHADGRIVFIDSNCYVGEIGTDGSSVLIAGEYPDIETLVCEGGEIGVPYAVAAHPDGRTLVLDQEGGQVFAIADDDTHTVELATPRTFEFPTAITVHPDGRILVADEGGARVVAISPDDTVRTIAGTGAFATEGADLGDGGPATAALLSFTSALAVDDHGRVLIADLSSDSVRIVDEDGVITTLVGTGSSGFNGDGLTPSRTQLSDPTALALTADGELLVADRGNSRIRAVR